MSEQTYLFDLFNESPRRPDLARPVPVVWAGGDPAEESPQALQKADLALGKMPETVRPAAFECEPAGDADATGFVLLLRRWYLRDSDAARAALREAWEALPEGHPDKHGYAGLCAMYWRDGLT